MPVRIADAQFTYTFDNWDKTLAPIVDDVVYTAVFKSDVNRYKVTFYDEDGTTVLDEHLENYGATPTFSKSNPTKASTTQYDYTFKSWDRALEKVVGETSYHAVYSNKTRQYIVTFLDEGGAQLQSSKWDYGATPVYSGTKPTKSGDKHYSYTFNDWDKTIAPVNGDATYTAKYKSVTNQYTVTFVDANGQTLQESTYDYGATPSYSGTVTPSKAKTAEFTYAFDTWSPAISAVSEDIKYTASFTSTVNTYTVRFLNSDGTELDSQTLPYGADVTYKGATPTKAADVQYTYTFNSWDKSVAKVTGDATYTATFSNKVNQYTIKFVNEDGTVLQSSAWDYGATPSYSGFVPTKDSDGSNAYVFNSWDSAIGTVTGDRVYKATFKAYTYALQYTYNSSTTSYTVSGKSGYITDVIIPETYNDGTNGEHPVYALADSLFQRSTTLARVRILAKLTSFGNSTFANTTALKEVTIPEGVTTLKGDSPFSAASKLRALTLPSTIQTIEECFFKGCYIETLAIPQGVTSFGYHAFESAQALSSVTFEGNPQIAKLGEAPFYQCKYLASITLPASISDFGTNTFEGCTFLSQVTLGSGLTALNGTRVFTGCDVLSKIDIPSTVSAISTNFFAEAHLTQVTIPASVVTIGNSAFNSNTLLTSVEIEDGSLLETLGNDSFAECPELTSFVFKGSASHLAKLGSGVFLNDTKLDKVVWAGSSSISFDTYPAFENAGPVSQMTFPSDWTTIPSGFFRRSNVTSYVVSRQITEISDNAFRDCTSLKSISFESGSMCTRIGGYTFAGCTSLTSVSLPDSLATFGDHAFDSCTALASITIPSGISSFGSNVFQNCTALTSLTLSDGLESLGNNAFQNCTKLASIKIPASVTNIGVRTFEGCTGLTSADLTGCVNVGGYASFEGCSKLTSFTIPSTMTTIAEFLRESAITSITVPGTVTEIYNNAFQDCASLASVTLSEGLKSIGSSAFENDVLLTSIALPTTLTSLGSYAFHNCTKLASVDFTGCNAISGGIYLFYEDPAFTSVTIPSSMTEIGSYLFTRSSLTSIVIPATVKKIDNNAFDYCQALTDFQFAGTMAQWAAIDKGSDWHINAGFTTVTCTDGVVTL